MYELRKRRGAFFAPCSVVGSVDQKQDGNNRVCGLPGCFLPFSSPSMEERRNNGTDIDGKKTVAHNSIFSEPNECSEWPSLAPELSPVGPRLTIVRQNEPERDGDRLSETAIESFDANLA